MARDTAPPPHRDCTECSAPLAMRLLEIYAAPLENVPLRYVCSVCGTMLTIPPRVYTR